MTKEVQKIIAVLSPEHDPSDKSFQELLKWLVDYEYGVVSMSDSDDYLITEALKEK